MTASLSADWTWKDQALLLAGTERINFSTESLSPSHFQTPIATSAGLRPPRRRQLSVARGQNVFSMQQEFHLLSMRSRGHAIAGENPWEAHHTPARSSAPRSPMNWQKKTQTSSHRLLSLPPTRYPSPTQSSSVPCSR